MPPILADAALWLGQTFTTGDLAVIALLIVLEGVLSIDNALVLGLLARRVSKDKQKLALTYGLIGAFVFRVIAIGTAAYLLKWRIVKLLGGGYLVYVALKHFWFDRHEEHDKIAVDGSGEPVLVDDQTGRPLESSVAEEEIQSRVPLPLPPVRYASFWGTVAVIELTDIAFAIDSILAAIALVGPAPQGHVGTHPKLWVVIVGGMLGVVLMRFAAVLFIKLLERFPRFETSAYLLVIVIGGKLLVDWGFNSEAHPHRIDFHDIRSAEFWIFWGMMLLCFGLGFIPKKPAKPLPGSGTTA